MPNARRRRPQIFEAEVLAGLAPVALAEARDVGLRAEPLREDAIHLLAKGALRLVKGLRTVKAVYRLDHFDIPRPKAMLGDQHFRRLVATVGAVTREDAFQSFRFGAAGRESKVMQRLADALQEATGLRFDPDDGELLLRFRPSPEGSGWEVLTRVTPRPLSARSWRVCNMPGGLNASLAAAMNRLSGTGDRDRYLNAMCGSGTLLIERAEMAPASQLTGCDLDREAVACARCNLQAAGMVDRVRLVQEDATRLSLPEGGIDVITADLPWGDAVGSHQSNLDLYPAFLEEMRRVAAPAARMVLLTHDIKLFEGVLAAQRSWRVVDVRRVYHGGHYPRIYLLRPEA
ncbi:MAG: methyltransferase domain-containing protein [Trueperaceae bacterium]|nr:MAG: methyltransferase domain-containing protein [Trueperaceae bacterium]